MVGYISSVSIKIWEFWFFFFCSILCYFLYLSGVIFTCPAIYGRYLFNFTGQLTITLGSFRLSMHMECVAGEE